MLNRDDEAGNRSNEIARAKRALDEKYGETPPAPFLGWHARGYLPHCDKPGLIQFVTFRLADAMPAERRHEWQALDTIESDLTVAVRFGKRNTGTATCAMKRISIRRGITSSPIR